MSNLPTPPKPDESQGEARPYLVRYAAVIIKNILGWALMLSAIVLGGVFPIPIGTPMFLIGFALITLPGKRRLTSGALRGIPAVSIGPVTTQTARELGFEVMAQAAIFTVEGLVQAVLGLYT